MKFVVSQCKDVPGQWRVETASPQQPEEISGALFYGRNAKARAESYARWMEALSLKDEVLAVRPR